MAKAWGAAAIRMRLLGGLSLAGAAFGWTALAFAKDPWPIVFKVTNTRDHPVYLYSGENPWVQVQSKAQPGVYLYFGEDLTFKYFTGAAGKVGGAAVQVSLRDLAAECTKERAASEQIPLCEVELRLLSRGLVGPNTYGMVVTKTSDLPVRADAYSKFYNQFVAPLADHPAPSLAEEEQLERSLQILDLAAFQFGQNPFQKFRRDLLHDLQAKRENASPTRQRAVVFGDQGLLGKLFDQTVAGVSAVCQKEGCDLGISVGDNVYPNGPKRTEGNWQQVLVDHFVNPLRDLMGRLHFPFYLVLGNHDIGIEDFWAGDWVFAFQESPSPEHFRAERRARIDAQVEFTQEAVNQAPGNLRYWNMDAEHYTKNVTVNGVQVFYAFLDTNYYPGSLIGKETPANQAQALWLMRALSSPEARAAQWRVVVGHHPLYSVGRHGVNVGKYVGKNDVQAMLHLRDTLLPVLCHNQVEFYLAGHDHHMELDSIPCDGQTNHLTQVLSGAASKAELYKLHELSLLGGNAFSPEVIKASPTFVWSNGLSRQQLLEKDPIYAMSGFASIQFGARDAVVQMFQSRTGNPRLLDCWTFPSNHAHPEVAHGGAQGPAFETGCNDRTFFAGTMPIGMVQSK